MASVYELAILLSLKDGASRGLDGVRERLRALGSDGRTAVQSLENLRDELARSLGTAGAGFGMLMALRTGVRAAGDFESAMTDLRLSVQQLGRDGQLNTQQLASDMQQLEALGVRLGNQLPGSTQDFIQMFSTLKQGGLDTRDIINGVGEAVAHLAVITGNVPKDLAEPFAQYAQQFRITGAEAVKLADTLARIRFATGATPQELIEGSKFFQLRAGQALGLKGIEGAEIGGRLLATLRAYGLEGGIGGRELGSFMIGLGFSTKEQQKVLDELRRVKGINLQFFDSRGQFLGVENAFRQMEKFRRLSTAEQLKYGERLFGREGMGIAGVMMQAGVEGWRQINERIDRIPPVQDLINQKTATYNAKMEALVGTIDNLKATAFTPMLDTLKPVVDTANELVGMMQELAKAHPAAAQLATQLVGIAGVTMMLTGGIRAMTTAWRLWRIAASVTAVDGVLPILGRTRAEIAATTTVIGQATAKTTGLKAALSSVPTEIKITALIFGVEYTIQKIIELKGAIDDLQHTRSELDRTGQLEHKAFERLRESYARKGEPLPRDLTIETARSALLGLNYNRQLEGLIAPGRLGLVDAFAASLTNELMPRQFSGSGPLGFITSRDVESYAASRIRERAPVLADPGVMREFRRIIELWKLSNDEQQRMDRMLQQAFPQSWAQSTQMIADEMRLLAEETRSSNAMMKMFGEQADKTLIALVPLTAQANNAAIAISRAAASADEFSSRLTTIMNINMPTASSPINAQSFAAPSRAIGGIVERDGWAYVHRGNVITPARVTRGINLFKEHAKADAKPSKHIGAVHININTQAQATWTPRDLARMVAYELERELERN